MEHSSEAVDAAVAVALALAAGMIAQSLARHLKLPGIVLLLAAGVLMGPDILGVVLPATLGPALHILVGFAVAVILFEGGLNLSLKRLWHQARVIQLLITVGALITAVGGTLAARLIMRWDWPLAIAFGTLVVVTGPTVVTPLLRRIKVKHNVETVLEAEGVLIDAIGAILAAVTMQVLVSPSDTSITGGMVAIFARLGFGLVCGLVGGFVIALALRYRKVVPDGLENVFTLSLVLALFQLSNAWLAESGIMTVTAAGLVVGNFPTRVRRELMEFKEQLTTMLIGMLFVLLAADVRLDNVYHLGLPGVATVACLMFVVRPLNIALSTIGSGLTFREKVFLSWLAPRGVVAAAVASLFAQTLSAAGVAGGEKLTALVFSVIAGTVVIQGLSGGIVAGLLGLRRVEHAGYAIFGADPLALELGRLLRDAGQEVIFLERDPLKCQNVQQQGFRVVFGNILEERTMLRAQLDDRSVCVAATLNEEVNLLLARTVAEEFKIEHIYVACRRDRGNAKRSTLEGSDAEVLFGMPRDLDLWNLRLRRELAVKETWILEDRPPKPEDGDKAASPFDFMTNVLLPMVVQRGSRTFLVNSKNEFRKGDAVVFAVFVEQQEAAHDCLLGRGWRMVESPLISESEAETDAAAESAAGAPSG